MLYSVSEVSETIGLSKQSIYVRLRLKEFQEHITKKQGVTYIDEVGLNLIKDDDLNHVKEENQRKATTVDIESLNLDKEVFDLLENSQVLLKDNPKQDLLMLEEHFQNLDNKLLDIRCNKEKNIRIQRDFYISYSIKSNYSL